MLRKNHRARRLVWMLPAALALVAAESPVIYTCQGPEIPLPQVCDTLRNPRIYCQFPSDVEGKLQQSNRNVRQRAADLYAWQTFIALQWPMENGYAAGSITAPGPRRWETWKETSEVFREQGGEPVAPTPWGRHDPMPAACGGAAKLLVRDEKVDDLVEATVQPTYADGTLPGTLTDQANQRVRYEIRMNQVAFDYVNEHRLWSGRVQNDVTQVRFPDQSQIVKAAWRKVEGAADRFITTRACVCEGGANGRLTDCQVQTMGLVGFHVMSRAPSAPQWIWSTFEQVDNVAGVHPSFRNPLCPDCKDNRQLLPGRPNQVTRVIPIPAVDPDCSNSGQAVDNVVQLNSDIQQALGLKGSVLQRYELISTQWQGADAPNVQGNQPATVIAPVPALLGNTTLETYIQGTSSCMGCHSIAGTDRTPQWVSSDFTFVLNDAWPNPNPTPTNLQPDNVPRAAYLIPVPRNPETPWDQEHWTDVMAGYSLATHTYEQMPDNVGSKLHCSSCHLGAGRAPAAAWWVGMVEKYKNVDGGLPGRINGCFVRSENGKAICSQDSPVFAEQCSQNAQMRGLITYMGWLDKQWEKLQGKATPPEGYPCLTWPPPQVSFDRGAAIYRQKCAFCHNGQGQGRYESDTYYRPALWDKDSYNAAAGFGNNLNYLAQFIHANMPYGNGGALTQQEAWDVAYFVDQHSRPGRTATTGQPPGQQVPCMAR